MVQNTGNFTKQGSDVFGTDRDVNVQQLLDSQREALLVGHHRDVVETIEVGQGLEICSVLDELLGSTVQQSDVRISADNLLAIEFQDQSQHTVGGRMLGPKVDCVMADLPAFGEVALVFRDVRYGLRVGRGREGLVGRNHTHALVLLDVGIFAGQRGRQGAGNGS